MNHQRCQDAIHALRTMLVSAQPPYDLEEAVTIAVSLATVVAVDVARLSGFEDAHAVAVQVRQLFEALEAAPDGPAFVEVARRRWQADALSTAAAPTVG